MGHGGVLRITAIGAAQLVCLNPPGWMVRLGHLLRGGLALLTGVAARKNRGRSRCAAQHFKMMYDSHIRRGVEQSGSSSGS